MIKHNKRKHIVLIITDQLRWDAVGYVNKSILTPNLNSLALESVNCTLAHTQSPQCQPSRSSLMTGRYPTAHKVWWNSINLPNTEITIGNYLHNAGYKTAYFGKLHMCSRESLPDFGFNYRFLYEDWLETARNKIITEYRSGMTHHAWTGRLSNRKEHHEDVITDHAINFIRSSLDPTFCVISYLGPHPPYSAPPPYSSMYPISEMISPTDKTIHEGVELTDEDWKDLKSQYFGMVSWIDNNIGKLLSELSDSLIIFTSDHGDILGDHGKFSKGLYAYDGNVRVPLLIKDQDLVPMKYNYLAQSIDILPTILDLLKIKKDKRIQGNSLINGFKNNIPINDYALSMIGHNRRLRMIRDDRYKYWITGNNEEFCFDLKNDKSENNIIKNSHELNKMRFKLLKALIDAEDPSPLPT